MTSATFEDILRNRITLPLGTLLEDGSTYFLGEEICSKMDDLQEFERFLVLSDGHCNVVGGVLFYGSVDIQALMLSEYQGMGYFSKIHKNGILQRYMYDRQRVTIFPDFIESREDVEKKRYLLNLLGLQESNKEQVDEILKYM